MRKIITKLYKYDSNEEANGYRGMDYSQYILMGDSDVDNLDDTLDTVEVTLVGLPFREEFAPETKFIYEKWYEQLDENGEISYTMWKDWHLCVSNDTVEQPILSDEHYFNHNISFIEASVVAQKRTVDNIAITYRLKDVSLNVAPQYDVNAKAIGSITDIEYVPPEKFGRKTGFIWETYVTGHQFTWVMPNWYQVEINGQMVTPDWSYWRDFALYQEIPSGQSTKVIQLPVPMLRCDRAMSNTTAFDINGYCSIDVIIEKTTTYGSTTEIVQQFRVDPAEDTPTENSWNNDDITTAPSSVLGFGIITSRLVPNGSGDFIPAITKVAEKTPTRTNRVITLTIEKGYQYKIYFKRHSFPKDINDSSFIPTQLTYDEYPAYYSKNTWVLRVVYPDTEYTTYYVNDNYPLTTIEFNAVLQGETNSLFLRQAPNENAYNLYNKAQLCTQNVKKQQGISVDDTITSFYLEDRDMQELKNTRVVENFYNQKNLWEIQMDIGKYIHARPLIRFGSNNRFVTTWKKYGQTDQKEDRANKVSIYNSRFIEEYISACSSYVTNMVQLGGSITETVAPKSSSDDYLVYNDVAEIIVEKPIIEIENLEVIRKSDGVVRNLAGKGTTVWESENGYVFEESVYNILSVNPNTNVNKGLAIYYKLGDNKIVGLNYQLPAVNQGDPMGEYSIKKILGQVYNMSSNDIKNIKVNDYLFRITYKTKDTLRSNQARPDMRKYLLSTPYDRVPQHNQFNNQTDVLVDSVKFGNNVYGKLIRTGNTIYTKLEWVDDLLQLKQSGELYTIDGNLYYVSKVKNTYYADHIESEVEFSKDFNRLSQIIGIPSEPRFYEISERSSIDREISLDDYVVLEADDTIAPTKAKEDGYINNMTGFYYIGDLLLGEGTEYPKYAATVFKNDKDKSTITGNEEFKVETLHPVCTYSIENTLTIEWDMHDNFSAGDQVEATTGQYVDGNTAQTQVDTAYNKLKPYRYGDVYGRCDMIDFAIFDNVSLTKEQVMNLPENPIDLPSGVNDEAFTSTVFTSATAPTDYDSHEKGIIILKDNREVLKFNYNLQVLTDSDRFVLSAYMWQKNKHNLRLGLLNKEINKISNSTIPNGDFVVTDIPFSYNFQENFYDNKKHRILMRISTDLLDFATSKGVTLEKLMEGIKAIVIYSTDEVNDYVNSGAKYFVFGRNIGGLDLQNATHDWHISYKNNEMFQSQ